MDGWVRTDGHAGREIERRTENYDTVQTGSLYGMRFSNIIFWWFILKREAVSSSETLVLPARMHGATLQKTPI